MEGNVPTLSRMSFLEAYIKKRRENKMCKKIVSLFTLGAFVIFNLSCYSTKKVDVQKVAGWEGRKVVILSVLKTSGEHVGFSKDQPGIIFNDKIVGSIGTKSISIPLSEVELVWIRKVDPGLTFLAVVGGIAAVTLTAGLIVLATKESCPFIYSFDGQQYIFDAEPYGGAICEGLERTEWCGLENLNHIQGQYKILVTNEVNETQYTDELKLVLVDHPQGVTVVPDISGRIQTLSQPVTPLRAYDGNGRHLVPYVRENDWIFWQTRMEDKNPERVKDLRDELFFEFPKPEGAREAKLLFNGCNSLWGSQVLKRYLDLYGKDVHAWYKEVKNHGPAYFKMLNMHVREELYSLQIKVETEKGWESKGLVIGGGPFISENKVCLLDIRDVPGDTLRIKLTPPSTFWMINYMAVDYSEDLPVQVREISPVQAVDHNGKDIREMLAKNDNDYFVMPNIGDRAELIFDAPPLREGMARSVILKASGYYEIHLQAQGEPQVELLERIHTEPGFAVKQALKEYLDWGKEITQLIRKDNDRR
jgi:hypothetical protein